MELTLIARADRPGQLKKINIDELDELRPYITEVERDPAPKPQNPKMSLPMLSWRIYREGGVRADEDVEFLTGIEFDYDDGEKSPEWAQHRLEDANITACIYTTPSDTPNKRKWRVMCPLSGRVPVEQYERLLARLNGVLGGLVDPQSKGLGKAFWFGRFTGEPARQFICTSGFNLDDSSLDGLDREAIFVQAAKVEKDNTRQDAHEPFGDYGGYDVDAGIAALEKGEDRHDHALRVAAALRAKGNDPKFILRFLQLLCSAGPGPGNTYNDLERIVATAEKFAPEPRSPIQFYAFTDEGGEPPHDFVEDTLTEGGASIIYGESAIGKTFWCLHLARCAAAGEPFMGFDCDQVGVLYISAEGGGGIWKRRDAMRQAGMDVDVPLHIIPAPLDMFDKDADTLPLIEAIKAINATSSHKISLIFFDTLAKVSPGAEENQARDMGIVLANLDRVRDAFDYPIHRAMVHHKVKSGEGMRGSSALFAGVDTVIELKKVANGIGVAKVNKQKDLVCWADKGFRLVNVDLGFNTRGKPYGSCVVEAIELEDEDEAPKLTGYEDALKNIIDNLRAGGREPRPEKWNKSGGQISVADVFYRLEVFPYFKSEVFDDDAKPDTVQKNYTRAAKGLEKKGFYVLHDNKIGVLDDEIPF